MTFSNGDVYEGKFRNDKMHGRGTCTYAEAEGERYKSIGEWKEGKKCGEFEDIVRTKVYYEDGELKADTNVKRE